MPTDDVEMTLTCPLRDGPPLLLDHPWYRHLADPVREERCPLSGLPLTPQNVALGVGDDGRPVEDTRGRCPEPCETVWWMEGGAACYAGRLVQLDLPDS